jgi:opacity protein-like surface antigen
MAKLKVVTFVVPLLLLATASAAFSQDVVGSWGVGAFVGYNRAMFKLDDWYQDGKTAVGGVFVYVVNPKTSVEVEYHRSRWMDGELEELGFTWSVDGKSYKSPGARSEMRINSFLVNVLIRQSGIMERQKYSPYVAFGTGFYDYTTDVRGLIFPGQKTAPIDKSLLLEAFSDTRTALGVNVGAGVEGFIFDNVSVDLRGRYNVLLGELRPMEAWGIEGQTFPMQFWNVRAGMRFYFKG